MVVVRIEPTLEATAFHEAGHALAAVAWVGVVHEVHVRRRGHPLGWTVTSQCEPVRELAAWAAARDVETQAELRARIRGFARYCLAGWAAEELYRGSRPVFPYGLADDEDAVHARAFLDIVGAGALSKRGALAREYRRVISFLRSHRPHLDAVAAALVKRRKLRSIAFYRVISALPEVRRPIYRDEPKGRMRK